MTSTAQLAGFCFILLTPFYFPFQTSMSVPWVSTAVNNHATTLLEATAAPAKKGFNSVQTNDIV